MKGAQNFNSRGLEGAKFSVAGECNPTTVRHCPSQTFFGRWAQLKMYLSQIFYAYPRIFYAYLK